MLWGNIIDCAVVTTHDIGVVQQCAIIWFFFETVQYIFVFKKVAVSERRTLLFTVLSKLFPCTLSPDVCMSYNYGSGWSQYADETFWVIVMCSCPFVLRVFANAAGLCSVICSALS